MNLLAVIGIALGEVAILLDWGSRLFGAYVRGLWSTAWRMVALAVAVLVPLAALFFAAVPPDREIERWFLAGCGVIGAILFLHYLLPYRRGIERLAGSFFASEQRPCGEKSVLREWKVPLPGLPAVLEGAELLVLADMHSNSRRKLGQIEACVDELQGRVFDCVLFLGDFGEKEALLPELVDCLAKLKARGGAFCVRGNHDLEGSRPERLHELLEGAGIELLSNEFRVLDDPPLTVLGVELPFIRRSLPDLRSGDFVLAVSHTPDNLPRLSRLGVDLVLAGHTHGGALRLPLLGEMLVPTRHGRFLKEGFYRKRGTLMHVTPGFGYRSPGEVTVLRLCRGEIAHG